MSVFSLVPSPCTYPARRLPPPQPTNRLLSCPVYCPCRFSLYEPVEFIRHFLLDKLEFQRVRDSVAVHVPCSSKKMGVEEAFMKVGGHGGVLGGGAMQSGWR